ncbi:MAG: hypothetical protein ABI367_08320 [Mucilaginibacter sp.]
MNIKKIKVSGLLLALLLLTTGVYAQDCADGPGLPGVDVDAATNQCPIDTWVIVLVIATLAFATYNLYQKQKAQRAL